MKIILILGGYGATGKLLAKHLLAQTGYQILIGGRNLDKARAFVDSVSNPRLDAIRIDAGDIHLVEAPEG